MYFRSFALAVLFLVPLQARAAVVLVGNYTPDTVTFSVAEPKAKAREHKLPANHVVPVFVTGPADLTFSANGKPATFSLDPYNAYVFRLDEQTGVQFEGVELPGVALVRDTRPEEKPVPRDPPVKVPVMIYVDDAEARAEKLWQKELRVRFDEAAEALEKATSIRLEFAGFGTWKSDPDAKTVADLLTGFDVAVKVKPGELAVGYSSRVIDDKVEPAFGANRGIAGQRILLRESRPKNEAERSELLLQHLAQALGAVGTPDEGSAMRAKLGNGYILRAGSVLRLDPLNALALNLWADERRRDPTVAPATTSAANKHRLTRVYRALLKAAPDDALATGYIETLEREAAKNSEPTVKNAAPTKNKARDELARQIVMAVTERAKQNTGPEARTGDELTTAYIRAAAEVATANKRDPLEVAGAFLIALGIALDDTDTLFEDAAIAEAIKGIETAVERKTRLAVLGNPTLAGRRDLCRRFAVGCALGELLPQDKAERAAVERALGDRNKTVGLCVPVLAAEFAGIAFARACQLNIETLRSIGPKFVAADYLPAMTDLRNGLSAEKFAEIYGDSGGERFLAVLTDVRKRIKDVKAYK